MLPRSVQLWAGMGSDLGDLPGASYDPCHRLKPGGDNLALLNDGSEDFRDVASAIREHMEML